MDPTDTHSQEHEGDFINITQLSNLAGDENVHHSSVDEVTNQPDVSPPQVTENSKETKSGTGTTQETSRNDDGSETENDVGKEKDLEKDHEGSWSNVEDKKRPKDVLKEIQMQKTHDLYCSNCTHNITGTAKLFEKGQETFPYNIDGFVFVIIFSFKYPFIYLPWLYNTEDSVETDQQPKPLPPPEEESVKPNQTKPLLPLEDPVKTDQAKPHIPPEELVKPSQAIPPLREAPPIPKPDTTLATLQEKIRGKILPNRLPSLSPTSQRFLLVLVFLLLSVILLLTLPSRPSPPPPPPPPGKRGSSGETGVPERTDRGGVSFSPKDFLSTPTDFLSDNYLPIIILLFLAILAVLWRSMTDTDSPVTEVTSEEKPKNDENQKEDTHNKEGGDTPKKDLAFSINLDILKSIVYGGLIESITSFGVVSSAAASGSSTLNVLALGLANLFSGLFIIIHNLYGLFKRPRYQSWNNDHMPELVPADPYEELLGKRNRVILHCFVVLVSFLFFGVIPPLFYGFSFKITDKGPYQEAAVFITASLVCVISLSFAKAYAFRMDKPKTVAAYTGIAIVGSALSFVASQHVRDVFAKYDFHKLPSDYLQG